jgi:hypothetical protein
MTVWGPQLAGTRRAPRTTAQLAAALVRVSLDNDLRRQVIG